MSVKMVDRIMEARDRVASDRDLLRNILRVIKARISRLEEFHEKRYFYSTREELRKYKSAAGAIIQAIDAMNDMLKSPDKKIRNSLNSIFTFLVGRIKLLQDFSYIFSCKFRGIDAIWRNIVLNADEFKSLLAA